MRHCVLIGDGDGDNRLTVAVATRLITGGATVVIVAGRDQLDADAIKLAALRGVDDEAKRREIDERALTARPVLFAFALGQARDLDESLRKAVTATRPDRLLALSQDFEQNLRVAVVAQRVVNGRLPVVLRSFDPDFGHQLEHAKDGPCVERAYSVAHLSAPSFVAAALLEDPKAHQLTMRVGVDYVSVYRIELPSATALAEMGRRARRRGLVGRTPNDVVVDEGCQVLARCPEGGEWACVKDRSDVPLEPGEQILLGGPMTQVINLARGRGAGPRRSRHPRPAPALAPTRPRPAAAVPRQPLRQRISRAVARSGQRLTSARQSSLIVAGLFAVMTTATFWLSQDTGPGRMIYQWVGTALGNATDSTQDGSRDAIAAVGLATGGIMLGLLTSMMSAWFVRERIVEDVRRRARRMRRHVIIVGLDDVALQVAALLRRLDVPSTVVVPGAQDSVDALAPDGRVRQLAKHTPILTGELVEMLDHAQIDRAQAVVACSEDNLVNVQACMRAKRDGGRHGLRMIARIFNDEDAVETAKAFQIDSRMAAVDEAAPAFADAALKAGARGLLQAHGGLSLRSIVWQGHRDVDRDEMKLWHQSGIRMLALIRERKVEQLPVVPVKLAKNELAVLAGPEQAIAMAMQPAR
jgi:hypothetical protein